MLQLITLLTIVAGPWITGMGNNGFSVTWTTEEESLGWVRLEDGETGASNSMGFCGKTCYEDYLQKQLEWAKEAFK